MDQIKTGIISFLLNLFVACLVVGLGIFLSYITVKILKKTMSRANVDPSLLSFCTKSARIIIYIFTALAALSILGIPIAGVLAFFSAAAAAIALALKDRLSDVASGVVILFTKPFVTGDFIKFGSYEGFIKKIDVMHTTMETYDKIDVIVPNSQITGCEVSNYTRKPDVRVTVEVPIPYDADIDLVKEVLYKAIDSVENTISDDGHIPAVRLEKFGESSLDFTAKCYCDYKDYWTVYYALTEKIKELLDENGITIPYNQLDVTIKKD